MNYVRRTSKSHRFITKIKFPFFLLRCVFFIRLFWFQGHLSARLLLTLISKSPHVIVRAFLVSVAQTFYFFFIFLLSIIEKLFFRWHNYFEYFAAGDFFCLSVLLVFGSGSRAQVDQKTCRDRRQNVIIMWHICTHVLYSTPTHNLNNILIPMWLPSARKISNAKLQDSQPTR